jgi:hypothetical protein
MIFKKCDIIILLIWNMFEEETHGWGSGSRRVAGVAGLRDIPCDHVSDTGVSAGGRHGGVRA